MEQHLSPEKIRKLAEALDDAIESRKTEEVLSLCNCELDDMIH